VLVKYDILTLSIVESSLQLKSETILFRTYVYMKIFICFDVKNSFLKFVQAF